MSAELIFDTVASVAHWHAIDDRVMGGMSCSRMDWDAGGFGIFTGTVSVQNNGGFASVRISTPTLALANASGYRLQVRGDGQRYKLNLRTDSGLDGINYQAAFQPPPQGWCEICLPLADFTPTFRGRVVPDAPPLRSAQVCQVGLMIAERQAGPFALAIRALTCL